ncbi:CaiB/BaiF CoA transferase family protein [Caballeronia ptereochthonis]|uniref:L-carnitine dehydratase/bile acid-inducible protein F n=1 Tax=Caballeronia ptereochthonis TaxID=1777144 RepID=A0A157ZFB2_9BURK|nr:CaiB/BaiF CoA-transferase family protein [Caballeronia ptereochthonis]SAK44186.1 L-carnitine dehydratase/bile acid-inducible protein F [Caballeronia ptereochthonis]
MGPLAGVRIVELAGIGPGPVAAMLLADLGATVIRVDRKEPSGNGLPRPIEYDVALRNRKSIRVDLKDPAGRELVLDLVEKADALIEGFRPGVTERLGLGPDACMTRNFRLVYGRVTGWGQDGPLAQNAGHDLNYIAVTGVLNAIGPRGEAPSIPLNVIGDYAGGSLYLALGLLAGIFEARASGVGQVVDTAIVDGVASLMTVLVGLREAGMMNAERGSNMLDSGAHFYQVYECADGKYLSVAPIEKKFYLQLLERLDIDPASLGSQMDARKWSRAREILAARFRTKPRGEWLALFEGTDACVSPVLDLQEAYEHPHMKERGTFIDVAGVMQPAPAPRFSRTKLATPRPPAELSTENARAALDGWLPEAKVAALADAGAFE